jgi:hypothetical protein
MADPTPTFSAVIRDGTRPGATRDFIFWGEEVDILLMCWHPQPDRAAQDTSTLGNTWDDFDFELQLAYADDGADGGARARARRRGSGGASSAGARGTATLPCTVSPVLRRSPSSSASSAAVSGSVSSIADEVRSLEAIFALELRTPDAAFQIKAAMCAPADAVGYGEQCTLKVLVKPPAYGQYAAGLGSICHHPQPGMQYQPSMGQSLLAGLYNSTRAAGALPTPTATVDVPFHLIQPLEVTTHPCALPTNAGSKGRHRGGRCGRAAGGVAGRGGGEVADSANGRGVEAVGAIGEDTFDNTRSARGSGNEGGSLLDSLARHSAASTEKKPRASRGDEGGGGGGGAIGRDADREEGRGIGTGEGQGLGSGGGGLMTVVYVANTNPQTTVYIHHADIELHLARSQVTVLPAGEGGEEKTNQKKYGSGSMFSTTPASPFTPNTTVLVNLDAHYDGYVQTDASVTGRAGDSADCDGDSTDLTGVDAVDAVDAADAVGADSEKERESMQLEPGGKLAFLVRIEPRRGGGNGSTAGGGVGADGGGGMGGGGGGGGSGEGGVGGGIPDGATTLRTPITITWSSDAMFTPITLRAWVTWPLT